MVALLISLTTGVAVQSTRWLAITKDRRGRLESVRHRGVR